MVDAFDCDVLIAGAGTTGAAAAWACARRGLRVRCLERGALDAAGARWVNGVPAWAFDEVGLDRPVAPEAHGAGGRFVMVSGWGPHRVDVDASGLLDVDMRLLVARLQETAREAGAELEGGCGVRGFTPVAGGARVETDAGSLTARVVVDATGLAGARLAGRRRPPRDELCAAAQEVRAIRDVPAAQAWCDAQQIRPGETVCFTGIEGGYSILNVSVSLDGEHSRVAILTGSVPAAGHPSGQQILDRFVAEQPWVGDREFGGARAIPLTPPADRLDHGPLVSLGDAGGQVFAAHGSGIASGLLAAAQLAEVISAGGTPWDFNVRWQRTWGPSLLASNHFARFSRSLSPEALSAAFAGGLMPAGLARQTLLQHPARPGPADLAQVLSGVVRQPAVARRFLPVVFTMSRLERHQRRYPIAPTGLDRWIRKRNRWLGWSPERAD